MSNKPTTQSTILNSHTQSPSYNNKQSTRSSARSQVIQQSNHHQIINNCPSCRRRSWCRSRILTFVCSRSVMSVNPIRNKRRRCLMGLFSWMRWMNCWWTSFTNVWKFSRRRVIPLRMGLKFSGMLRRMVRWDWLRGRLSIMCSRWTTSCWRRVSRRFEIMTSRRITSITKTTSRNGHCTSVMQLTREISISWRSSWSAGITACGRGIASCTLMTTNRQLSTRCWNRTITSHGRRNCLRVKLLLWPRIRRWRGVIMGVKMRVEAWWCWKSRAWPRMRRLSRLSRMILLIEERMSW